ncbi:protein TIPIN homolog [Malaya genurostris]|uniref:protein TIPIN homolog n=1 Tax=Malaya genurostris TaxID=325434 RepID=UPI0026F3A772|nr:protein TIPIN homolog [Malaya genurostris]
MSHFDALFGNTDEFGNENDGEILSDDGGPPEVEQDGTDDVGVQVKVESKKRTIRNPRLVLNVQRLCGPRGIVDMESYFKGIKLHGKGHEPDDLDAIMKRMQHWAHRMFPKYGLDDTLAKIEILGRKKQMQSYMNKYRMNLLEPEITDTDDGKDEDGLTYESNVMDQPLDPLDSMLEEQIAISRAANLNTSGIENLSVSERNFDSMRNDTIESTAPSYPLDTEKNRAPELSEEIRARITANRLKALEIRRTKMVIDSQKVVVETPST